MHIPIWGVALVVAAMAPFCVNALTQALQRRRRVRARAFLAQPQHVKEHRDRGDG